MEGSSLPRELRETIKVLEFFLRITGPDQPPGFANATRTDRWSDLHQGHVLSFLSILCSCLFEGISDPPIRKLFRPGADWPPRADKTLTLIYETVEAILRRWHVSRDPTMSYEWGNPPSLKIRAKDGPLRIALLAFPLTLTKSEYENLRWGYSQFVDMITLWDRALDKKDGTTNQAGLPPPPKQGQLTDERTDSKATQSRSIGVRDVASEPLGRFFDELREFTSMLVSWQHELNPEYKPVDPKAATIGFNLSGYSEAVIEARNEVDWQGLPDHEKSLFITASELFDEMRKRCGSDPKSSNTHMVDRPALGDETLKILSALVSNELIRRTRETHAGVPKLGTPTPSPAGDRNEGELRASKADVLRFLVPGGDPGNTKRYEKERNNGMFSERKAEAATGHKTYLIKFNDPSKHAEFAEHLNAESAKKSIRNKRR